MFIYLKLKKVVKDGTTLDVEITTGESQLAVASVEGKELYIIGSEAGAEVVLARQHAECAVEQLSFAEAETVIKSSRIYQDVNEIVKAMIRKKYSHDDELKLLNLAVADSADVEYAAYREYVAECRAKGNEIKINTGLKQI